MRNQADQAIRESETKLQLSLKASNMGVFYWHPGEDRTEADARVLEIFGLSSTTELTIANALDSMLHPDDREGYAEGVKRALDRQRRWQACGTRSSYSFSGWPRALDFREPRKFNSRAMPRRSEWRRPGSAISRSENGPSETLRHRSLAETLESQVRIRTRELSKSGTRRYCTSPRRCSLCRGA